MQGINSTPILSANVSVTIDTMLKFDTNVDANVNIDIQCEWTFADRHRNFWYDLM